MNRMNDMIYKSSPFLIGISSLLNQLRRQVHLKRIVHQPLLIGAFIALMLGGCDGHSGSGAENQIFDDTSSGVARDRDGPQLSGPAARSDDVQAFRVNLWNELAADDRCGDCHGAGGQTPRFVSLVDINTSYDAALTVVNLLSPGESRLVAKIAGGHSCWESSDSFCAGEIQRYISNWAAESRPETFSTEIQLIAPPDKSVSSSKNFPEAPGAFEGTVYPILTEYCSACHSDSAPVPQTPYFASSDVNTAYEAVQSRMDLETPSNSRLVVRLRDEFHNCWSDCSLNAAEMNAAIQLFSDGVETTEVDPNLVVSKAVTLLDGVATTKGVRHTANAIAIYEFTTGSGVTAFDTSGVAPAMHLNLSGDVQWLGSAGIRINNGKAQATTSSSKKLADSIVATGEYSLEAWVTPANVVQEDARILSYSGGVSARNFSLGQTLYNYDFLNRSSTTNGNGDPALSTDDDEEILQATLQHVIVTYDPNNGRRIFVNGDLVDAVDSVLGGTINEWNDTFAFVIGNEVSSDRLWQGSFRYVAVHNRVLSETQIRQNFEAGVGELYSLLFDVSEYVGVEQAYIVFEVSQFDGDSYLFANPYFFSLETTDSVDALIPAEGFVMKGMRIGINGREAVVGQTFTHLDFTVQRSNYNLETGASMIAQYVPGVSDNEEFGAVIALEQGAEVDEFFLTFEQIGDRENVFVEASPSVPGLSFQESEQPRIGIRTFEEINHTMSEMTGVAVTESGVAETYEQVRQQLPSAESIDGFLSSHQMAITQMAIQYCDALVEDTSLRAGYFSGFNFGVNPDQAFNTAGTDIVVDAFIENMLGTNITVQPTRDEIIGVLVDGGVAVGGESFDGLIDTLNVCPSDCDTERTETIVKASCAAVLGSAVMLIQ